MTQFPTSRPECVALVLREGRSGFNIRIEDKTGDSPNKVEAKLFHDSFDFIMDGEPNIPPGLWRGPAIKPEGEFARQSLKSLGDAGNGHGMEVDKVASEGSTMGNGLRVTLTIEHGEYLSKGIVFKDVEWPILL